MGGGGGAAMLRGVGRLAPFGAGARGGAGGSAAAAASVCSSCNSHPHGSLKATAVLSSDCACETAAGASPSGHSFLQNSASSSSRWIYDQDEWVFTGDELERPEYGVRDHLVFGKPPSHAEVEEATSELQSALSLGLLAPEDTDKRSLHPLSTNESNSTLCDGEKTKVRGSKSDTEQASDWIEPQLIPSGPRNVQVGYVAEAFHLLRTTPIMQGVVMSLAQDKAVWDAILNNDKVKEYRRQLQESGGDLKGREKAFASEDENLEGQADSSSGGLNILSNLFEGAKHTVVHLKELILDFIKNMLVDKKSVDGEAAGWTFKAGERTFWTFKAGDATDRTLKSCFMLATIVTFIVLMKRAGAV